MLNQRMMDKRLAMRLHGMVEALKTQEQDRRSNELSFTERLALLVDQQWSWRENQALTRRLKAAKLKGSACVEDIDYRAARDLDKTAMRALAKDSTWVRNHENIFVIGPCGVGKSFLASALAQKACRDGYSALYLRAAALSRELALVRADGSMRQFFPRRALQDSGSNIKPHPSDLSFRELVALRVRQYRETQSGKRTKGWPIRHLMGRVSLPTELH